MTAAPVEELLDRLSHLRPADRFEIAAVSGELRSSIEQSPIPASLVTSIPDAVREHSAWAVRSSATAEDLPKASFAGQHDTFLNVVGYSEIIDRVRRCWASLFTERAVTCRQRNDIDHRSVGIAVIVQQMVIPNTSGVMFTADPITFDRTIIAVEACVGLGEALVSGLVNPDVFKVRGGKIVEAIITSKSLAIRATPGGGTWREELDADRQRDPSMTDAQVVRVAALGRRVETHFGCPQDIEWCLVDDEFHIVQSRPITTLFPIPPTGDDANHVYLSVGHNQMMTDAIKPLGLSLWQLTTPAPMSEAVGRFFVDITARLAAPSSAGFLDLWGKTDPLLRDALQTVLDRGDFIPPPTDDAPIPPKVLTSNGEAVAGTYRRGDLPNGALVGLAASAGTIEGRARVITDIADADLEPGDILVTTYTDPSWTPLFVAIAGLVTDIGGMMTHGAVIAREYGLPAVVSVERATEQIRGKQRIRVHGTDGYVVLLPADAR